MRVSANSLSPKVAGAVAGALRSGKTIELQCIGAMAVYRAVFALSIATTYLKENNLKLDVAISNHKEIIDAKEKAAGHMVITFKAKAVKYAEEE